MRKEAQDMKQMNKLITGVVTLATVVTLSACQSSHNNTKLVSMKGDTITVSDFYNETKNTELAQKAMLSLVISRVFETQYANKVSDKEVEKAYKQTADQYGTSFKTVLAQSGLTPETYKKQIRLTKLVEYAVQEQAKNETISKKDYRQAYDAYTPTMTAEIMQFEKEEDAKAALEAVKAEGADFAAIAKEKTIAADKKTTYTFDSGETTLPAEVVRAASGLKEGNRSEIITALDPATSKRTYHIIKVTKKATKKADWKAYQKRLKDIIVTGKLKDPDFQNKVIAKALDKANVKIKDKAFANILAQFAKPNQKQPAQK